MPYMVFNPPLRPKSTGRTTEVKVISNEFGDGYAQVVPDGINAVRLTLSLSWPVLTQEQAAAITGFLAFQNALPFQWTLPDETRPRLWRCLKWSHKTERGLSDITAEFTEVFA